MDIDPNNPIVGFGLVGIIAIVAYVLVLAGIVLIVIRIAYAVIWRAVRRGLTEFYRQPPPAAPYVANPPIVPPGRSE
ncbi:hypothetical protein [Naasia lichenicola]|uniref:Uncharacterized protein n=1 Tax=Naasia lichenicola TaxID=2565933 RepID=A0A4S4FSX3_9MICO|nr:hypothetical protein [Naasia lichenicola]THG33411.1 hypothetical protein E6C64_03450 [Naasia lichenicola]